MHVLTFSLGLVAVLAAQVAGQSAPASNNENIYANYDYCQGASPIAGKTYKPIKGATLQKVQVLMRHGDRTPSTVLPGDKTNYNICSNPAEYNLVAPASAHSLPSSALRTNILVSPSENLFASAYWGGNCEVGQLTNKGSLQTRQVGQRLREIYIDQLHFLPKRLDPEELYVRNTYIWRTRMSAENFLDGFYPPHTRDAKNAVITLNTYPQSIETLILNPTACPKLGLLYQSFFKTATYANFFKSNYALMTKVNTILGVTKVPTVNQTLNGDTVMPRYCNNLPLGCNPQDPTQCLTKEDVVQTMTQSTFLYSGIFRYESTAEEIKRLAVGPILKTLSASIRSTQKAASSSSSHKNKRRVRPFELYSAHDQSLDQILAVIADPSTPWPAYASSVIIEQWKTAAKKDVIRVLYEGKVVPANPKLNCTLDACPLETFLAFIESYVPTNIAAECSPY
ncbi:histidine phosphatase superfamily [Linnemannia elongata]|nr:histidine phosphatase superfamily [Linnemannia elongata]